MNESEMSVSLSMLSLSDCQPEDNPEPELNQIPKETPQLDDWNVIDRFSDENLNDFLECYSHKMTMTHGKQLARCSLHPNLLHNQEYGYLRCTSMKCIQNQDDCCPFIFKVNYNNL